MPRPLSLGLSALMTLFFPKRRKMFIFAVILQHFLDFSFIYLFFFYNFQGNALMDLSHFSRRVDRAAQQENNSTSVQSHFTTVRQKKRRRK